MTLFFKTLLFLFDFVLLNVSIITAFYIFDHSFFAADRQGFAYLVIYSNLAWLFLIMVSAPYSLNKGWTISKILRNQVSFLFIHLLVVASLVIFFDRNYDAYQIASVYLLFIPLFFGYRIFVFYARKFFIKDIPFRNYLLIGRNPLSAEIRRFYLMNPELGYRFKGYADFEEGTIPFDKIQTMAVQNEIHEIFCCAPSVSKSELSQLVNFGLNSLIKVKIIVRPEIGGDQTIQLEQFDKLPGLGVAILNIDDPVNRFIKRGFDLVFAGLVGVLLLSWFIPIVAILIKIDSKGPVFFVQERKGRNNVPFGCLKFRTMVQNQQSALQQAERNDPRITKLGSFLRKSSIDELPQFINVILGDMSIVGPRPQMPAHYDQYSKIIETFMARHYVKSGITGLAQCMGYRGEILSISDMENRVQLDRYYIENWTFWLDIKIIFLTVVSLIRGSDKAF